MGVFIYLSVSKSVSQAECEPVYREACICNSYAFSIFEKLTNLHAFCRMRIV